MPPLLQGLLVVLLFALSARAEPGLQEHVAPLPFPHQGPFVRGGDRSIWGVDAKGALVSRDEGRTWVPRTIYDVARFDASGERALLRTKEGVLLYAFLNLKERAFKWDDAKGGPQEGCRLPVYLARSGDDGRTWAEPVKLQDGWCGAVRQMIQLRTGRVLLICQQAAANPGRHVTINYYSDDLGRTWQASDTIDLGDAGNYRDPTTGIRTTTHGGGLEGTVVEKANGDLKLLLRVPHGYFYELTSKDGAKWSTPTPSMIEASDSPGTMHRLASGRVVLLYNRFRDPVKRLGRREALSIAFSENDGLTWSPPQVIAVNPVPAGQREGAYWISYPYVFEVAPGKLWISTMQGKLSVSLNESDFVTPLRSPLDGPAARVILLGDSITKGSRPGVSPTQTFAALTQASLRSRGARVQVHNIGIGGERTDQALVRLERDVITQRPHLVTVMYGTNDSWVDEGKTASRLSERQFEDNLREIVRRLQAAKTEVVLMTEPRFGEQNKRNGLGEDPNVRLGRYMEITRRVAREGGVTLVDHFAGWAAAQESGRALQAWTTDGCHPNFDGHSDLAARMVPVLAPLVRRHETAL
ncbi:GDSL-type esterase/lipase family protein [Horticoccus sp. 23ND18S-11]|uniref:GDSL-type esterase/lipase family protein n=1 Tax=Horticoccus sp. 23ND18S-11 TaxID=3391832 RepID=UPI0039C96E78